MLEVQSWRCGKSGGSPNGGLLLISSQVNEYKPLLLSFLMVIATYLLADGVTLDVLQLAEKVWAGGLPNVGLLLP